MQVTKGIRFTGSLSPLRIFDNTNAIFYAYILYGRILQLWEYRTIC